MHRRRRWRRRYEGWPALEKLAYVDELMGELAGRGVPHPSRRRVEPAQKNPLTLAEFYQRRQAHYGRSFPSIYDRDLLQLFSDEEQHRRRPRASVFLRRHKNTLRKRINRWTGENQYTLEQVFRDMIGRCQELGLHLRHGQEETLTEFAILLTVRTLQYFYGRPHKHPL
ncbi:MAG: hypothetical protein P1V51_24060 [Deltaproteobacteria bacterium]|nr:hypothetical protein [Deltaproteobacteria bacterium]